jgi:hypothetical protein
MSEQEIWSICSIDRRDDLDVVVCWILFLDDIPSILRLRGATGDLLN